MVESQDAVNSTVNRITGCTLKELCMRLRMDDSRMDQEEWTQLKNRARLNTRGERSEWFGTQKAMRKKNPS